MEKESWCDKVLVKIIAEAQKAVRHERQRDAKGIESGGTQGITNLINAQSRGLRTNPPLSSNHPTMGINQIAAAMAQLPTR